MSLDQWEGVEGLVSMSQQRWPGETFAKADFEKTIIDVLSKGQAIQSVGYNESDQQAKVVRALYEAGVLQSELEEHKVGESIGFGKVVYVFPTLLHARYEPTWLLNSDESNNVNNLGFTSMSYTESQLSFHL